MEKLGDFYRGFLIKRLSGKKCKSTKKKQRFNEMEKN